jgi:hypothetical protein
MDQLNDKQRQIIRLAFTSKDPELRRRAVERVMTARYTQEFKDWANSQGGVFTHPDTGNQVRFNSLPSQSQKEVYRRYEGGDYEDKGGPAAGGGGGDDAGGGRDQGADDGGGDGGGGRHSDRKELRGKPSKSMDDKTGITEEAMGGMFPMAKLDDLDGDMGDRIKKGIMESSYQDLEALHTSAEYMAQNPDDDYTKNHWLSKIVKLDNDEMKKFHKALGKKLQDAKGRKYNSTVLEIANNNNLEGVDADAMHAFRKDKPEPGYRELTPEQLKQKFLQGSWADAETKARVREMSVDDFMAMRNAILAEEEDELSFGDVAASTKRQANELSLFDRPPGSEDTDKEASLSTVGRKIVRMAFHSKDPEVRRKLVRRARAELTS